MNQSEEDEITSTVNYRQFDSESAESSNIWELNYHEAAIFLEVKKTLKNVFLSNKTLLYFF